MLQKAIMFRCVSGDYLKSNSQNKSPDIAVFNQCYYAILSDITIHGGVDTIDSDFAVSEIARGIEVQQPKYLLLSHHHCCETINERFDDACSEKSFYTDRLVEAKKKALVLFPYFSEEYILLFYFDRSYNLVPADENTMQVHGEIVAMYTQSVVKKKKMEHSSY